jgi:CHAD domain-containing protein
MSEDLQRSADEGRSLVRSELAHPAVVATLLALTEWVDGLSKTSQSAASETVPLRRWARHRLADWHRCFKVAFKSARHSANPEQQHRARILAKRLRYGVEALGDLLPAKRRRRWRQQAVELQARLGSARDLRQAHALAVSVAAADDIQAFWLRLADESAELTADQSS